MGYGIWYLLPQLQILFFFTRVTEKCPSLNITWNCSALVRKKKIYCVGVSYKPGGLQGIIGPVSTDSDFYLVILALVSTTIVGYNTLKMSTHIVL